jgi:hypothetical protein
VAFAHCLVTAAARRRFLRFVTFASLALAAFCKWVLPAQAMNRARNGRILNSQIIVRTILHWRATALHLVTARLVQNFISSATRSAS